MANYRIDTRDVEFVLYEQLGLEKCLDFAAYKEMNKETFDLVFQEGVRFAQEVLGPANIEADKIGAKLKDGEVVLPEVLREVHHAMREGGWYSPMNSPEFGGMGLPIPLGVALYESFIGACSSFFFFPGLTCAAGHLIEAFANEELKELYLHRLYGGEWTGTMCLTEPQAGSSLGDIATTAVALEGSSSEYLIKGNKIFISAGDHTLTDNIVHLVLARVPGDAKGTKGISIFVVPKYRINSDGAIGASNDVKVTAVEDKMGIHAAPTCSLSFGDNGDCHGYLIGEQSKGIVYMFQMMNEARLFTGVQGVGLGNSAYLMALSYAKERVQGQQLADFGKDVDSVAIINHPDVRRNLMLCKATSEGIRAMLLQTAMYAENAKNHPDESVRKHSNNMVDFLIPICKAYATDEGFKVTELAIRIHGGYGYITEYGVEQCMRDVKIASLYEGTNGIQAMDLLGRKMRIKDGMLFINWMQEIDTSLQDVDASLNIELKAINSAKEAVATVAMYFQGSAAKDVDLLFLSATPFLKMCGHLEVARLLVQQAAISSKALEALFVGAEVKDAAAKKSFIKENVEAKFYDGKIKSARFFVLNVLPDIKTIAAQIKSGDRSALEIEF